MNDTHRGEIFNGINAIKGSKEFKMDKGAQQQLDEIMGRYQKGGGLKYVGHLRQELTDFINNSTKLSPEKKASYLKDFDKYFGPMTPGAASASARIAETNALEAESRGLVESDLARAQSTRGALGPERDIVGGVTSGVKAGASLLTGRKANAGLHAYRAVQALRGKVPTKEMSEALKSDDAMKEMVRRYDRVSSDAEVDKMVAALMGRGVGQTVSGEQNAP
jgi:hypothetical protein